MILNSTALIYVINSWGKFASENLTIIGPLLAPLNPVRKTQREHRDLLNPFGSTFD